SPIVAPLLPLARGRLHADQVYPRARGGLRLATAARNRLAAERCPRLAVALRANVPRRVTPRTFAPLRVAPLISLTPFRRPQAGRPLKGARRTTLSQPETGIKTKGPDHYVE